MRLARQTVNRIAIRCFSGFAMLVILPGYSLASSSGDCDTDNVGIVITQSRLASDRDLIANDRLLAWRDEATADSQARPWQILKSPLDLDVLPFAARDRFVEFCIAREAAGVVVHRVDLEQGQLTTYPGALTPEQSSTALSLNQPGSADGTDNVRRVRALRTNALAKGESALANWLTLQLIVAGVHRQQWPTARAEIAMLADDDRSSSKALALAVLARVFAENAPESELQRFAEQLRSELAEETRSPVRTYTNAAMIRAWQARGDSRRAAEWFSLIEESLSKGNRLAAALALSFGGDFAATREVLEQQYRAAISELQRRSDRPSRYLTHPLHRLAVFHAFRGNVSLAEELALQALQIATDTQDDYGRAAVLRSLGLIRMLASRINEAEPLFHQALVVYDTLGAKLSYAWALLRLVDVAQYRGDFSTAESLSNQALVTLNALRPDSYDVGYALATLATAQIETNRLTQALAKCNGIRRYFGGS